MTNFEKILKDHIDIYKEKIFNIVAKDIAVEKGTGKVCRCEDMECNKCEFYLFSNTRTCTSLAKEWLQKEVKMEKKVVFRGFKKFPKVEKSEIHKKEDLIEYWRKRLKEKEGKNGDTD